MILRALPPLTVEGNMFFLSGQVTKKTELVNNTTVLLAPSQIQKSSTALRQMITKISGEASGLQEVKNICSDGKIVR